MNRRSLNSLARALDFPELFPSRHIQLPPVKAPPIVSGSLLIPSKSLSRSAFQERLALIHASLGSGQLSKAELLFNRTYRTNVSDVRSTLDIQLVNAFIRAHLRSSDRSGIERSLDWYHRISDLGFKPTIETFASLIHAFLFRGDFAKVDRLLQDMSKTDLQLSALKEHDLFADPEDQKALEAMARRAGFELGSEHTNASDQLLMSAIQDKNEPPALPPNSDLVNIFPKKTIKRAELLTTNAIGVQILKRTLGEMQTPSLRSAYDQQIWLEERAHQAALEELDQQTKRLPEAIKRIAHLPSNLVWAWHKQLVPALEASLSKLSKELKEETQNLMTFVKLLPPEMLSRITIAEMLKLDHDITDSSTNVESAGIRRAVKVMQGIGKSVEREYNLQQFKKNKNKKIVFLFHK